MMNGARSCGGSSMPGNAIRPVIWNVSLVAATALEVDVTPL